MYDERLVRAAQEGDEAAFAALYDRAVDSVYDLCWSLTGDATEAARLVEAAFVLAARNLDQLSDPSQVRPWLLAIAGDQALADDRDGILRSGWESQPVDGGDEPLGQAALRRWVSDAAAVLALPDQFVLELQLRHDLDPDQLAAAIGCTAAQLPGVLERVDDEARSVLSALVLARQGRRNCAALAALLADWDAAASVDVADTAAAHAETCTRCARRRRLVDPLELVADAPLIPAPAALRAPILELVASEIGRVPAPRPAPRKGEQRTQAVTAIDGNGPRLPLRALLGAAGALLVLIVAVVVAVRMGSGSHPSGAATTTTPTTAAASPSPVAPTLVPIDTSTSITSTTIATGSSLALNTSRVDLGAAATTAQVILSDSSAAPANWTASTVATWISVAPASGYLGSGQSARVTFTVDRHAAPSGPFDTRVTFAGTDQGSRSASIEVVGTNSPTTTTSSPAAAVTVSGVSATQPVYTSPCPGRTTSATVTASVTDGSGTPSVTVTYTLPGQSTPASQSMTQTSSGQWTAQLPPSTTAGTITFTVYASDGGASGQKSGVDQVQSCPGL
jgi:DNA-directed RNA polymerase specialized sigma24 family protein